MAFKLDFAKLAARSPKERAADEARRETEARAAEIADREAKVKHTRTVTLTEASDVRHEMDGSRAIHFMGTDDQGRAIRGHYQTVSYIEEAEAAALIGRFAQGRSVTMRGYFRAWTPKAGQSQGKTQFAFVGLFLAD